MLKLKEGDILNQVRDYLKLNGFFVVRHQQSMGSHKGFPDLTALKNGITLYVEIKTPIGKLSQFQIDFAQHVRDSGNKFYVLRSYEDAVKMLKKLNQVEQNELFNDTL